MGEIDERTLFSLPSETDYNYRFADIVDFEENCATSTNPDQILLVIFPNREIAELHDSLTLTMVELSLNVAMRFDEEEEKKKKEIAENRRNTTKSDVIRMIVDESSCCFLQGEQHDCILFFIRRCERR